MRASAIAVPGWRSTISERAVPDSSRGEPDGTAAGDQDGNVGHGYFGASSGIFALSLSFVTQTGRLPGHSVQVAEVWRVQNDAPSELAVQKQ
jgi:hypothetical protein